MDTGLIGRKIDAFQAVEPPPGRIRALAVLAAAGVQDADGFTLWQPLDRRIELAGDAPFGATLQLVGPGRARVVLEDGTFDLARTGGEWTDGLPGRALRIGDSVSVFAEQTWAFEIPDPLAVGSTAATGNVIEAPMPGLRQVDLRQTGPAGCSRRQIGHP